MSSRQYEVVVFGATGYTGKYTAEHITTHLPTDLKWAIAGRSESKLQSIATGLRSLNPDRIQPGIEVALLEKSDLVKLAKKTKVLISTVGPYHRYGSVAVEACAETGTHYVDCTGEVPWVHDIINRYEDLAKKTGAILVPQNGVESAPADLTSWMLVNHIRRTQSVGTAELLNVLYKIRGNLSGGTILTALSLFESYNVFRVLNSLRPWSLSAVKPPKQPFSFRPLTEILTGTRIDPDLGILSDSISGPTDTPIVNRSWSLYDGGKFYGPRFKVSAYMGSPTRLRAFLVHIALAFGALVIIFPPARWLLKKIAYQPGDGPSRESVKRDFVEWRGVASPDVADPNDNKRAFCSLRWEGSLYELTGVFLAHGAIALARDNTPAHQAGGGFYTPALLGAPYLERLQKAGLKTELKTLPS